MDMDLFRWGEPIPLLLNVQIKANSDFLSDSWSIPFAFACTCLSLQTLHVLLHCINTFRNPRPVVESEFSTHTVHFSFSHSVTTRAKSYGGWSIYLFMLARLFGSLLLFALSLYSFLGQRNHQPDTVMCPQALISLTFLYCSAMAMVSVTVKSWSASTTRYNILVLFTVFTVYLYRDIWPLATVTNEPEDIREGYILWIKFTITTLTAVIIPLFIPRQYVPVDQKNPMPEPNPEQTCSLFALVFYTYLDPVIMLGYRLPHLRFDQLPPLADTDYSQHITRDAFPHLDPYYGAKRRHLFFGLMRVFRVEYMILSACVIGQTFSAFAAPTGINRLLNYLETDGGDTFIRPWFWICWLLAGPIVRSLCFQWYTFLTNRTLVRAEGLLTQLVFEHSLRIRLKAESSNEKIDDDNLTIIGTPDSASISEGEAVDSNSDGRTNESRRASTTVTRDPSCDSRSTSRGVKRKNKRDPLTDAEQATKDAQNPIGKINNLVTTDLGNIVQGVDFILIVLYIPLQTILCVCFLYKVLGWSAFVGITTMFVLFAVPGYIAKKIQDIQVRRMKMTDARVQDVTEAVSVLRMIKLFGWEHWVSERIRGKRNEELGWLWKLKVLETLNGIMNNMIPAIVMLVTYATYTLLMKEKLTASKIFSSLSVFSLFGVQLRRTSYLISTTVQAKVSLDRMNEFLNKTELLDSFVDKPSRTVDIPTTEAECEEIGFKNATFSWSAESSSDGSSTPYQRTFRLHIRGEQLFKRDCINLIIGPTGSGKTSMLMALLGEMHFIPSTVDSWYNLPRNGGVAYAAQESWVQNDTIRNNILFGSAYDEVRYHKVIHQCALERDLELFDAGDQTEVGERGLTLSGGQKARVTLARAVYSTAKILLLDDVLAALDVHTSSWIIDRCLRGDLVKERTVLLVTHNVPLAAPIAQHVVSIGHDGTVQSQGIEHLGSALTRKDSSYSVASEAERSLRTIIGEVNPHTKKGGSTDGKLVIAEEIEKGHVTWKSVKLYLAGLGGDYPLTFFSIWISASFLTDWMATFQVWFLGYWGSQYETHAPFEINALSYLTQYSLILATSVLIFTGYSIWYAYGSLRASRKINASLVDSVLTSTLRWLDETPTARVITRCTQDIRAVDGPVPEAIASLTNTGITMLTKLVVIIIFTPIFLSPTLAIAVLGFCLGNFYLRAQLSAKREMSNARSPVLAHFGAAIVGLVSIRAYGAQVAFKTESLARLNHYLRIARMSYNLNRWIGMRIDLLGATFTAALASYLIYGPSVGAGNTGFSLNMVVEFSAMILWWVRYLNEFEVQGNSLERIQGYIDIEHEPKATEAGKPPAAWPTSGDLRVENLSARYSQTGPAVLHNLSFHIKSGQRIGVVGRTGSGKSSLTLALLRCIFTEGTVYYDGIPTNQVNLDALRSNITIIPQTPELLSGTLRSNLDPFEQHDDATLNDVLHSAGLFSLQAGLEEGRLTLDSNISSGGGNLSVGQRQILALARAIVRGSKLLILDEATSAIDHKTDSIIQNTLRHEMGSDVTIITVAHRLQTIMDADKIMVLDNGRIAEFDTPDVLLQKEDGFLRLADMTTGHP